LAVPAFQRNYSWTKIEVSQFLTDIYESARSGESHFWGPVVVLQRDASKSHYSLIDGQQRITTAVVMLSILRDAALKLNQRFVNVGLASQYELPPGVRNSLFLSPQFSEPRFEGSYLINEVLSERIIADPTGPNPNGGPDLARGLIGKRGGGLSDAARKHTKELRAAYLQIQQSLKDELEKCPTDAEQTSFVERVFHALTRNFEIHTMVLISEDDAYTLFESLNDRGLRLSPTDLLKTFTLDEIRQSGQSALAAAIQDWDDAVTALGDYDFTKFLRHYLLTRTSSKIQNRKIFSEFKGQVNALAPNGATKNLAYIASATQSYAQLIGTSQHPDPKMRQSFERMNIYSKTHRIFLLGMLEVGGLTLTDQQKLTRAIEFLSYRWISTGGNAQELETIYQEQFHVLRASPIPATCADVMKALMDKAPDDQAFGLLTESDSPALQRYLLTRIEQSTGGAIAGSPELEHLAPQQPGNNSAHWHAAVGDPINADAAGNVYEDYVYNWGNLTLLEKPLNRAIKNSPWPQKLSGLPPRNWGISNSNYNLNQRIKTEAAWTKAEIINREAWLKSVSLVLLSKNWVTTGVDAINKW
jgi:hypothetical protein